MAQVGLGVLKLGSRVGVGFRVEDRVMVMVRVRTRVIV